MKKITLLFVMVFVFISCQEEDNTTPDTQVKLETVLGKVTSPSNKPISNALVFYDDLGTIYSTKTNTLGEFEIEVPEGEGQLHIQTGNGKLFNAAIDINLQKGQPLTLETENLKLNANANFAFLAGEYDSIETVVSGLGYDISEISISDIENNHITDYDVLFINCGETAVTADSFYNNLHDFTSNGGSLYASDYALDYLVGKPNDPYSCIEERLGGFILDDLVCGTKTGTEGLTTNNNIVSSDLSNYMNTSTVDIDYDLIQWMQLQNTDTSFWEVFIEDQNQNPLLIKTNNINNDSDDDIWYSNNGNKVTICHIPPGNPNNSFEITISVNALAAHLAHGDTIGSCNGTSGNIYYTSFHNHLEDVTPPETEQIMEYVILNL